MKPASKYDWSQFEPVQAEVAVPCSGEEEMLEPVNAQQQTAAFDKHVLDGISVAALLAIAVLFLWLLR